MSRSPYNKALTSSINDFAINSTTTHFDQNANVGIGTKSNFGGDFLPKNICMKIAKLTKCLNFTRYLTGKINKIPEFYMIIAPKMFLPQFFWAPPSFPCLLRL